ncbi:cold-shock protein [Bradyrhizobium sp. CCBAU 51745]|uniref:cold-shock protein n=1 Tax=Bradyrhizobium sp. CCBAU 51745 TaxID=1325099 RepID=UPI003FA4451F
MIATGRVTWFKLEKKFGFVTLDSGEDAFLHIAVLKTAGYVTLPAGTTVQVRVARDGSKLRIAELVSVDTSTADGGEPQPVMRKRGREPTAEG